MKRNRYDLPANTQAIVTEEQIKNADFYERCRLMREIVRGAKYSPAPDPRIK